MRFYFSQPSLWLATEVQPPESVQLTHRCGSWSPSGPAAQGPQRLAIKVRPSQGLCFGLLRVLPADRVLAGIPRRAGPPQGERKGQQSSTPAETPHSANCFCCLWFAPAKRGKSVVFCWREESALFCACGSCLADNAISVDS